ncbi:MAG: cation diffusion facilitator family transporter [Candidatus Eisenbacteria bacterium]|uniref:Cation diffusion facilitator family transporter n=1 Tax=Eiseniibacteriota bacterium TaxID=2212470 RepID=A0A948WBY7_UNCEI|nr:cation diffusion facilitator family transporter [Candidatus Eisenbacteria bacterium]MBU2690428.1 cation diffusion facilitator family transporter [Candidatus Eisenbacteria bacterium]
MTPLHKHKHGHSHGHRPAPSQAGDYHRTFIIGICLNAGFVFIEALSGIISGSLALLADAGHNLSDVLGLILAWGATRLATRAPTPYHTYGFRRSTIFAALLNAIILLFAIGGIAWESMRRLNNPPPVAGGTIMIVAAAGIVINGLTAWLFWSGRRHDLNIRGAFLHMAADTLVSAGVVLAGLAITLTHLLWIDPLISFIIVVVIFAGTWGLLKESVLMAMDAVPKGIDPVAVRAYLTDLPGVTAVHDLHIWATSTTQTALTVHLVKPDPTDDDAVLTHICIALKNDFGISHPTIQWERNDCAAPCAPRSS